VLKNDYRHQAAIPGLQWTLENQIDNPLITFFADVMRWCQPDFLQINLDNKLGIGIGWRRKNQVNGIVGNRFQYFAAIAKSNVYSILLPVRNSTHTFL
jgi:hypothetical protein